MLGRFIVSGGATTLGITTFSITTLSISLKTLHIDIRC